MRKAFRNRLGGEKNSTRGGEQKRPRNCGAVEWSNQKSLDAFLDFLGSAESQLLRSLDFNLLAGCRIAAKTGRTLPDLENPKSCDANLVALLEVLHEEINKVSQQFAGKFF